MAGRLHLRVPTAWKLVIQDWEERERRETQDSKTEAAVFYNLISEVTSHLVCNILLLEENQ